jgi:hypothetical protein
LPAFCCAAAIETEDVRNTRNRSRLPKRDGI